MNIDPPQAVPNPPPQNFDSFFPDDENGRLLRQMQEDGVEMDRSHRMDFFFEFPGETNATAFHCEENEPLAMDCCYEMGGRWIVRVSKSLIPTHRAINEFQNKLIHIAAAHKGRSEGWGYSPG